MSNDITRLLAEWQSGRVEAGDELIALTYAELRRLARSYLRRERAEHTLQATALVHEAYARLLPEGPRSADGRDAFFRLMASEMRHRLVDHARRRMADKRGGGVRAQPLDTSIDRAVEPADPDLEDSLERLDRALTALEVQHPRAGRVVQLRYIAGLTTEETAAELGLSTGTVKRDWIFARAWLTSALSDR